MQCAAQVFATRKHEGQKRRNGVDYITHPAAVAASVAHLGKVYEDVAWLHDVMEDCGVTVEDLKFIGFRDIVITNVLALTKRPGESYLTFVLRCRELMIARAIKIADIKHNLQGNVKPDKYLLALWILENT